MYVPTKTVIIRQSDQPWCNSFTRLLLRKKNHNYNFYKEDKRRVVYDYKNVDQVGLINYIKSFDFENNVFCHPRVKLGSLQRSF